MEESIYSGDIVLKKFIAWRGSDSTSFTNSPSNLSHPRNISLNASQKVFNSVASSLLIRGCILIFFDREFYRISMCSKSVETNHKSGEVNVE